MSHWDETTGRRIPDDHLLTDEEEAHLARADLATPRTPVPTQLVSNGEYAPLPQSAPQKQVEARINQMAEEAARKLGVSRRRFLMGSGGMAASFLAMNEIYGPFFDIDPLSLLVPEAYAAAAPPSDLFVFDDQLHMVRGSRYNAAAPLRALAQGPSSTFSKTNPLNPGGLKDEHGDPWGVWNRSLVGLPDSPENFLITQFIKDVYLDSQVTVGLLSNVPAGVVDTPGMAVPRNAEEAKAGEILTAAQTAAARDFVNKVSGSKRMLAHALLYVGKGNLDYIRQQAEQLKPDSWKGYNIGTSAKVDNSPNSPMRQWRHDDEAVAYPTFELIQSLYGKVKAERPGFNNICVHKGLVNSKERRPEIGHPMDLPKAAKDWPQLNFITYHACIQPAFFMYDSWQESRGTKMREGVPDIAWTTEYAVLCRDRPNTYAEIGTTWAASVVTFPTLAAHLLGQLLKFMGPDRVVFGSDSVWWGSPQWQIDALWRFQIPEEMQKRYGYPALTEEIKRKILGLNSAKLYGIRPVRDLGTQFKPVPRDYASKMTPEFRRLMEVDRPPAAANGALMPDALDGMRERYAASGMAPDHMRYGWVVSS
ncbi:MAG TPA: amidohydrolase family protein [Steroidobacteraceae bacterium]|nr:amidohydrolase family protein [Steroidobacteraceae bacterium]